MPKIYVIASYAYAFTSMQAAEETIRTSYSKLDVEISKHEYDNSTSFVVKHKNYKYETIHVDHIELLDRSTHL